MSNGDKRLDFSKKKKRTNKMIQKDQDDILPRPLAELLIQILMRSKMEQKTKPRATARKKTQRPYLR